VGKRQEKGALAIKILISGLTAAGKTTHARRLAQVLDLPYFSASQILAEILGDNGPWSPRVDLLRADHDVDREVDRRILQTFDIQPEGVFDAWALPWLTSSSALRVWLESDLPSRVRKAFVTELRRGNHPEYPEIEQLVLKKDDFSRRRFQHTHRFDIYVDRTVFDLVIDNSSYIPRASIEASDRGIKAFELVLLSKLAPHFSN
jgi:cytidylate kinase